MTFIMKNEQTLHNSIWFDAVKDEKHFEQLSGEISAEVVVIGAGIAGIMTAWQLAKKGMNVVVLEKNHVATGDTGFTTAFITRVPDASLGELVQRYRAPFVKRIFTITKQAQDELKRIISEEQIDCDYKDLSSYFCAYDAENKALKEEWEVIKQADADAEWVSREQIPISAPVNPIANAVKFNHEGRFHVRKFLFGLLSRPVAKQRIRVYEQSPVVSVKVDEKVVVRTSTGRVIANKVIVATGLPTELFSELQPALKPAITYALAAECTGNMPISDDLYWDTDQPYQYYRRYDDHTVILGGADQSPGTKKSPDGVYGHEALKQFFSKRFAGVNYRVTHEWSGTLFESTDGLPYATAHPHYPGKIFVIAGLNGNGMVMGTMCAMIASDLITATQNQFAPLFSFARTKTVIAKPGEKTAAKTAQKNSGLAPAGSKKDSVWISVLRYLLPLTLALVLIAPAVIFFSERGGLEFLEGATFQDTNLYLFPLVGLYAFMFVWLQLMIGSNINYLRRVYPRIELFHRTEGIFAILFAMVHPTMRYFGLGLDPLEYLKTQQETVVPALQVYLWLGYFQLTLLTVAVAAALLRKTKLLQKHWRKFHYFNYIVFVSVWIHGWFLGSDVQYSALRYLWIFVGVTGVGSILARLMRSAKQRKTGQENMNVSATSGGSGRYVRIASVADISDGAPFCAQVEGLPLAIFKLDEAYYALDNKCSHAGGPLCEGTAHDGAVECPWHGSRFDMKTGAVAAGPAQNPQKVYRVRVNGDGVEVEV